MDKRRKPKNENRNKNKNKRNKTETKTEGPQRRRKNKHRTKTQGRVKKTKERTQQHKQQGCKAKTEMKTERTREKAVGIANATRNRTSHANKWSTTNRRSMWLRSQYFSLTLSTITIYPLKLNYRASPIAIFSLTSQQRAIAPNDLFFAGLTPPIDCFFSFFFFSFFFFFSCPPSKTQAFKSEALEDSADSNGILGAAHRRASVDPPHELNEIN